MVRRRRWTAEEKGRIVAEAIAPGAVISRVARRPWPFPGRPPKHDLSTWTITDDGPHPVPVTEAEIEVFEQWFGGLFEELFGSGG